MNPTALAVAGLYAALNTFILLWITARIGGLRQRYRVFMGDGGNAHMIRAMRGHANAIETIPMAIILMMIMAATGTPVAVIHVFGIVLTVSRALHAWHFMAADAPRWQRFIGATGSILVLALGAIWVLAASLWMLLQH